MPTRFDEFYRRIFKRILAWFCPVLRRFKNRGNLLYTTSLTRPRTR